MNDDAITGIANLLRESDDRKCSKNRERCISRSGAIGFPNRDVRTKSNGSRGASVVRTVECWRKPARWRAENKQFALCRACLARRDMLTISWLSLPHSAACLPGQQGQEPFTNSPSASIALLEVAALFPDTPDPSLVVSLGTGSARGGRPDEVSTFMEGLFVGLVT